MLTLRPLFVGVRALGPVLLANAQEPAAELLAMVWGPRFDREHALHLARQAVPDCLVLDHSLALAADRFDALPPKRQQRLRQHIRHRATAPVGQSAHDAYPPD
jgi:hypothetical protein